MQLPAHGARSGRHGAMQLPPGEVLVEQLRKLLGHDAGKLLGVVGRSRLLRAEVERVGARTRVRFGFEEQACLFVEAPRERHLEQLAWVLSADQGRVGQ